MSGDPTTPPPDDARLSALDHHLRPAMQAVIVGGLALAVRLVYLWQIHHALVANVLVGDARSYDAWARQIAAGDWIGHGVFYQAPLYPYLLGVIYAVGGHGLMLPRLVQAVMGAGACVLLMQAGRRFVGPAAGFVAGIALALYAPAIFFDGIIQKASLDTLLVCLLLWTLARPLDEPRGRWFLGAGLTLGALMLSRENAGVLVACALAWAVLGPFPAEGKQRAIRAGWLALGLAVVLTPVVARNLAVGGEFHLSTSQFGSNFYIGNNPRSDGTYVPLVQGRGDPAYEREDATRLAERELGRKLSPGEVSAYWTGRTLAFIREEPGRWLRLMGRKSLLVWNAAEIADTEDQQIYAESSPLLRGLCVVMHMGVIFPLACAGAVLTWRGRGRLWVIYAILLTYAGSVALFYVFARYRLPLVPPLLLLAAGGMTATRGRWSGRRPRLEPWLAPIALAAGMVVANWPMIDTVFPAVTHCQLGQALAQMPGRLDEAVGEYRKSIALDGGYAGSHFDLGLALLRQEKAGEAVAEFRATIAIWPNFALGHRELGAALNAQEKFAEAAAAYRASLRLDPGDPAAHNGLGIALARLKQLPEALEEFRTAVGLDGSDTGSLYNLARCASELGHRDEAAEACRRILRIKPDDADAAEMLRELTRPAATTRSAK